MQGLLHGGRTSLMPSRYIYLNVGGQLCHNSYPYLVTKCDGYCSNGIRIISYSLKYGLVVLFNIIMWGCYVNSLKSLSSLQATVTNFATNFLSSGMSGYFLFDETLPFKWFAGAVLIVIGVIVLSKSSIDTKTHTS